MVNLYIKDIREPFPAGKMSELPRSRVERAMRFQKEEGTNRCLYAGLLLSEYLNVHSDNDIIINEYGKPFLRNGSSYFNLSHSGCYVALAVCEKPVGVDIERIKKFNPRVAQKCFTQDEQNLLIGSINNTGLKASEHEFSKLWTAKEAVMKAEGKGFYMNPAEFTVLPLESGIHDVNLQTYFITWIEHIGYTISVAVQSRENMRVTTGNIMI